MIRGASFEMVGSGALSPSILDRGTDLRSLALAPSSSTDSRAASSRKGKDVKPLEDATPEARLWLSTRLSESGGPDVPSVKDSAEVASGTALSRASAAAEVGRRGLSDEAAGAGAGCLTTAEEVVAAGRGAT